VHHTEVGFAHGETPGRGQTLIPNPNPLQVYFHDSSGVDVFLEPNVEENDVRVPRLVYRPGSSQGFTMGVLISSK
jgi:hypothetical protein